MKAQKVFTIGSIITFFALLPALIYMEIKVLQLFPDFKFLLVAIIVSNIILIGFVVLEIFILYNNWKKSKKEKLGIIEEKVAIDKEWNKVSKNIDE